MLTDGFGDRKVSPVPLRRTFLLTAILALGLLALTGRPAAAVGDPDYTERPPATVVTSPPPAATPVSDDRAPDRSVRKVDAAASAATAQTVARSRLAITGSDVGQTVLLGGSLLGIGVAVLVVRRRLTSDALGT